MNAFKDLVLRLKKFGKPIALCLTQLFRSHKYSVVLSPRGDTKPATEGFVSVALDPKLIVRPTNGKFRPGWYLISYHAKTGFPDSLFVPKIYPLDTVEKLPYPRVVPSNFGSQRDSIAQVRFQPDARPPQEKNTINLRAHYSGLTSHLIFYDLSAEGFRFDPFDLDYPLTRIPNLGWFDLEDFQITHLSLRSLLPFCLRKGIFEEKWIQSINRLATLGALWVRKGSRVALRWLTHRTYCRIQPHISLTRWIEFLRSTRPEEYPPPKSSHKPLITILLKSEHCDSKALYRSIQCIADQSYPNWELLISVEAAAKLSKLRRLIWNRDSRIKWLHSTHDNLAGKIKGDYVCVVDPAIRFENYALSQYAIAISVHQPDILYSDEAVISANTGRVQNLILRPAFSVDYFLATAFTGLGTLIKTSLMINQIPRYQDKSAYPLSEALILTSIPNIKKALHIPDVLQLRVSSCGTQTQRDQRLDKTEIQKCLAQIGFPQARVTDTKNPDLYAFKFSRPTSEKTAIIIPTKNNLALIRQAVQSIRDTVPQNLYDLVIVDHESTDSDCKTYLNALANEHIVLSYKGEFNFSAINNFAVQNIGDHYESFLFLNNDVEAIRPGWLESMRDKIVRSDVGIVGAVLLYPEEIDRTLDPENKHRGLIQHAGVILGIGVAEHYMKDEQFQDAYLESHHPDRGLPPLVTRGFSAVTAACLMTTPSVFNAVGGFDESLAVAFGDVDLCLKAGNLGYKVLCDGEAVLIHHESVTRGRGDDLDPHLNDSAEFEKRYGRDIKLGDPFYHPLLVQNNFRYRPIRSPLVAADPVYRVVDNPGFIDPGLNPNTPDRPT